MSDDNDPDKRLAIALEEMRRLRDKLERFTKIARNQDPTRRKTTPHPSERRASRMYTKQPG